MVTRSPVGAKPEVPRKPSSLPLTGPNIDGGLTDTQVTGTGAILIPCMKRPCLFSVSEAPGTEPSSLNWAGICTRVRSIPELQGLRWV